MSKKQTTSRVPSPALTREDWILLWKVEGGNMTWRRWCQINEIPEENPGFIEGLKSLAKKVVDTTVKP